MECPKCRSGSVRQESSWTAVDGSEGAGAQSAGRNLRNHPTLAGLQLAWIAAKGLLTKVWKCGSCGHCWRVW